MRILIISNRIKDKRGAFGKRVRRLLEERGCQVLFAFGDEAIEMPVDLDAVLVLGGDGTLLEASRKVVELGIPLLGVNLGTLGFLAEVSKKEIVPAMEQLLSGDYRIEERMMLYGRLSRGEEKLHGERALND
ncbi:MAG: NAD(+)/NADH kinase, partial [Lachnospiraceae bacterium]|nr:NAD(+)/NADH kinase [Lachnospiraceae bacterium]